MSASPEEVGASTDRTMSSSTDRTLFGRDRVLALDFLGNWQSQGTDYGERLKPLWNSAERPPDPMAYRVRKLLDLLRPAHRIALEEKYFLQLSTADMAVKRGCSERAVRGLLERARDNLIAAIAEHGGDFNCVPKMEY